MKTRTIPIEAVALLAILVVLSGSPWAAAGEMTVREAEGGLEILEDGKPAAFYQLEPKAKDGKWKRADYLHPVYYPSGEVMTEDFPDDHGHHRGIFWAWHRVLVTGKQMGDMWTCQDFEWDLKSRDFRSGDASAPAATVSAKWHWTSPDLVDDSGNPKPFVAEETRILVHPSAEGRRTLDFEIRLLALMPDVKLAGSDDKKAYGGFSVRMGLPEAPLFMSEKGKLTPQATAVEGGAWVDVSGPLREDGGEAGVTIFTHPSSPGFPQAWMLREKRSMQNPQWPGREPVALSKEREMVLRYRVQLHEGPLDPDVAERESREYARLKLH